MPSLLILICATAVIWLTQILQRVDLMVEDGGSLVSFLKVTIFLIPSLLGVIIPFAALAGALYCFNMLATDNELPVMGAAGASRLRIARPLILMSAIASVGVLIINADLQPRSYRMLKDTVQAVRSDVARSLIRSGGFSKVSNGITVYAEEARPGDQYIGLLIHDERKPNDARTYTAERGLFQVTGAGPRLLLARGTLQRIDPASGNVEILRFTETAVDLASFRDESIERTRDSTERYIGELFVPDLPPDEDPGLGPRLVAEGHARLATPLYPIAFVLMASAMMLTAPVSRRGHAQRILMVLAAAITLRTLGFTAQSAGEAAMLGNALQYLLPLIAIVASIVVLTGRFWRVKRRPPPQLKTVLQDPQRVRSSLA